MKENGYLLLWHLLKSLVLKGIVWHCQAAKQVLLKRLKNGIAAKNDSHSSHSHPKAHIWDMRNWHSCFSVLNDHCNFSLNYKFYSKLISVLSTWHPASTKGSQYKNHWGKVNLITKGIIHTAYHVIPCHHTHTEIICADCILLCCFSR